MFHFSVFLSALAGCAGTVDLSQTAWQGDLQSSPGGLSGSVAAVSSSYTETSIQISRALAGESYFWRINAGDCQNEGGIVGGTAVYPKLVPGESGVAGAEAALSQPLHDGGAYAARVVQQRPDGGEIRIACGVLRQIR